MRLRYALAAVGSLRCTWAAAKPVPGSEVDLAAFGRLKSWRGAEEKLISRKAEAPWQALADIDGSSNLGVEWDEPRDFSEVRVAYAGPAPGQGCAGVLGFEQASRGGPGRLDRNRFGVAGILEADCLFIPRRGWERDLPLRAS